MFTDIYSEDYNDRQFLIKGNTRPYKESIKKLGGFWKPTVKAWIFPNIEKESVEAWIKKGEHIAEVSQATTPARSTYDRREVDQISNAKLMQKLEKIEKMLEKLMSNSEEEDEFEYTSCEEEEVVPVRLMGKRR